MSATPSSMPHPPIATRRPGRQPARLAYSPDEAAAALGVSRDFFDEHIAPDLKIVRRGRRRLVPVRELERWLADSSAFAIG